MSLFGIWCHKLYRGSLRFSLFFKCLIWFLKKSHLNRKYCLSFYIKGIFRQKKKNPRQASHFFSPLKWLSKTLHVRSHQLACFDPDKPYQCQCSRVAIFRIFSAEILCSVAYLSFKVDNKVLLKLS